MDWCRKIVVLLLVLLAAACNNDAQQKARKADTVATQADNSMTGTYVGTLPCADCPGIKSTLVLQANGKYQLIDEYLERDVIDTINGETWNVTDDILTLDSMAGSRPVKFRIETEESLRQLDMEGNVIEGPQADDYIYKKQ